jgi:hypothetical protein
MMEKNGARYLRVTEAPNGILWIVMKNKVIEIRPRIDRSINRN